MTIQSNYPTGKPSLLLDFANAKTLDPRITFARASTATYYDGKTNAKAEENLLLYSEQFDNDAWVPNNVNKTANATTAPDGTLTADAIFELSTTGTHRVRQSVIAGTYTVSVFVKANGRDFFAISIDDSSGTYVVFNLAAGTIGSSAGGISNAAITASTNGFYRVSVTLTLSAIGPYFHIRNEDSAPVSYTGDITKGVYLWGAQLEQRSSVTAYTPTTTQPITNYIPVLKTASSGQARFDHSPVTDESLGLLIEEQRTNLLLRSEEFDNASWGKSGITITANTIVASDGSLTGDKFITNNGVSGSFVIQNTSITSGTSYTYTIYAKAGEFTELRLLGQAAGFGSGVTNQAGVYNLLTGAASIASGTPTVSMDLVGNGWYRCRLTVTATATTSNGVQIRITSTGDGYSGLYLWGAQLEAGVSATSYIPTVASQVTRVADVASITGTNFSSWYRADQGSLYCEATVNSISRNSGLWAIGDASLGFSTRYSFYSLSNNGTGVWAVSHAVNGVSQIGPTALTGTFVEGISRKINFAFKENDTVGSSNGLVASTDTTCLIPYTSNFSLSIGSLNSGWTNGANYLNGHIKKISYYPVRCTNAQLQALTS